jgi:hypothetical protein
LPCGKTAQWICTCKDYRNTRQDAPVNALIVLDQFAKEVNYEIEDQLENIRSLFSADFA